MDHDIRKYYETIEDSRQMLLKTTPSEVQTRATGELGAADVGSSNNNTVHKQIQALMHRGANMSYAQITRNKMLLEEYRLVAPRQVLKFLNLYYCHVH